MAMSGLQKSRIFTQSEVSDYIKYVDAVRNCRSNKQFVTLGRKLNSLGTSARVKIG